MREMFEAASMGRVRVWDLRRSVEDTRLPTGDSKVASSAITTFPPRYGAPRRFWKRKFIAGARV